jgi:hypothetical protein
MPKRTVIVAVAVLFVLTGLQDPIARDPFGAATITVEGCSSGVQSCDQRGAGAAAKKEAAN